MQVLERTVDDRHRGHTPVSLTATQSPATEPSTSE